MQGGTESLGSMWEVGWE